MAPHPPLADIAVELRELRRLARNPVGDVTPGRRAAWAEASERYDSLLLRAALMLDIPIGDAAPWAPPVLSERQRDLLETDLADAGLDVR